MSIAAAAVLAKSGEAAKSGPIGLAVILILCIACYFLFKSMSKHLKTVREDFPQGSAAAEAPSGAGADQLGEPPVVATGTAEQSTATRTAEQSTATGTAEQSTATGTAEQSGERPAVAQPVERPPADA